MKPESYHLAIACGNCKHYLEGYCAFNYSVTVKENRIYHSMKELIEALSYKLDEGDTLETSLVIAMNIRNAENRVEAWGHCDEWALKERNENI